MRILRPAPQRHSGQGLVEFALILPVLLFVVMGVIDFGRAMVVYSQGTNALRDAVRYAQVWGGPDVTTHPYLECDTSGLIQTTAKRVMFASMSTELFFVKATGAGDHKDTDTDGQPDSDGDTLTCAQAKTAEGTSNELETGDMLVVTSQGSFKLITPLLSNFVPEMTFHFRAQRTIVTELAVGDGTGGEDEDELPVLSVGVTTPTVTETTGTPPTSSFTVTLSGASDTPVTVTYTIGGSATAGSGNDYTYSGVSGLTGTLTWAAGDVSAKTITITVLDDLLAEAPETITLTLSSPSSNATPGVASSGTITIQDNDLPIVSVSVNPSSVTETFGSTPGATFTVSISTAYSSNVSVNYTLGGTATAGSGHDYTYTGVSSQSGTLTWTAGDTSPKTITVNILDDSIVETSPAETIVLSLSSPNNAVLGTSSVTLTINDNDTPGSLPQISVSAAPTSVTEGGSPATATFTISMSAPATSAVTVQYTLGGTAVSGIGNDYTYSGVPTSSGTLTWSANDNMPKTVTVTILDDSLIESSPNETITLALSNPSVNAQIATSTATLTILDTDLPAITVSLDKTSVTETTGTSPTATFTISLSAPYPQAVNVNYSLGGTATAGTGNDYTYSGVSGTSGTLSWAANTNAAKTITVTILDDTISETSPFETIVLALASPSNATVAAGSASTTLTIQDTDVPTVSVSVAPTTVTEASGSPVTATFTVSLSAVYNQPVSVQYALGGTATAGSSNDYTYAGISAASGSFSWAAGESAPKTVTVTIRDDSAVESPETIVLTLGTPVSNAIIGSGTATLTLNDNDSAAPTGELKVTLSNRRSGETIAGHFAVTNQTSSALNLNGVVLYYYFTKDFTDSRTLVYECDWATAGCGNITGATAALSPSKTGADTYLSITFGPSAGSLPAGATTVVQVRLHTSDWYSFTQSNDYSYNTLSTDWDTIVARRNGVLAWGTPP